jgi:hypothetical protein
MLSMTRRRSKDEGSDVHLVPSAADDPLTRSLPKTPAGARLRAKNPRSGTDRARKTVLEELVLISNP